MRWPFPPGMPGGAPPPGMPPGGHVVIGPVDPRLKGLRACPNGCINTQVIAGFPANDPKLNSWGRCMRCLTYWEVTPLGSIVNRSHPITSVEIGGAGHPARPPESEPQAGPEEGTHLEG